MLWWSWCSNDLLSYLDRLWSLVCSGDQFQAPKAATNRKQYCRDMIAGSRFFLTVDVDSLNCFISYRASCSMTVIDSWFHFLLFVPFRVALLRFPQQTIVESIASPSNIIQWSLSTVLPQRLGVSMLLCSAIANEIHFPFTTLPFNLCKYLNENKRRQAPATRRKILISDVSSGNSRVLLHHDELRLCHLHYTWIDGSAREKQTRWQFLMLLRSSVCSSEKFPRQTHFGNCFEGSRRFELWDCTWDEFKQKLNNLLNENWNLCIHSHGAARAYFRRSRLHLAFSRTKQLFITWHERLVW